MKPILLLTVSLVLFSHIANGQVKTNFNNAEVMTTRGKFGKNFQTKSPRTIPAKDIKSMLEREARENNSSEAKPFKIAEAVKVDIDVVKEAAWVEEAGFAHGKYTIVASGAKSISANFDRFKLPKGTELYVYNANGEMMTGPVTENENNENNFWGTWVYKGGSLTVDFKTPIETKSELKLHISSVAYGYKDIYVSNFGESAPCNVNVICAPIGTGWENERNSVSLILNGNSTALCSGALINNSCNLNIPYLLTANHCFEFSSDVANWKFTFQAWSPICDRLQQQNANGITFNGSALRANNAGSDFCLVELSQLPPANSGITFSGWNRNPNPALNTVCIHHPAGDVMKIAVDANPPVAVSWFGGTTNHWRAHFQQGTVQPGSSGSPLYDQNHRIVGQLHGDQNNQGNFCAQQIGEYGKFDVSWTGGGTNATRLSNWLDPNNTNAMTIDTRGIGISGSAFVCGSEPYTFVGLVISWTSSNPTGLTINAAGTATRQNNFNGQVTITTAVASACGNVNYTRTVWVGRPNSPGGFTVLTGNLNNMCRNSQAQVLISSVPGAVPNAYVWTSNNPSGLSVEGSGLGALITGLTTSVGTPPGYWTFNYGGSNVCGSTTALYGVVIKNCTAGGGGGVLRASVFPNPSNDSFTIKLKEGESKEPVEVFLFNQNMERVYFIRTEEKEIAISTLALLPGIYYLNIAIGKDIAQQQILVSH